MSEVAVVTVGDRAFIPERVCVRPGDIVRFEVVGTLNHLLEISCSEDAPVMSPMLRPLDTWEHTVGMTPAVVRYRCEIISYMRGEVEVLKEECSEDNDGTGSIAEQEAEPKGEAENAEPEGEVESGGGDGVEDSEESPMRLSGLSVENVQNQYRSMKATLVGGGGRRARQPASGRAGSGSDCSDGDSDEDTLDVYADRLKHKLDAERRVLNSRAGERQSFLC